MGRDRKRGYRREIKGKIKEELGRDRERVSRTERKVEIKENRGEIGRD